MWMMPEEKEEVIKLVEQAVGYMYLDGAVGLDVDIDTKWPHTWWRTLWVVGLTT